MANLKANLLTVTTECVEFLSDNSDAEYIFRVPGRKEVVANIVAQYESGETNVVGRRRGDVDVNDVSSVLKQYLTDSEKKLFSKSQVNNLLKSASKVNTTGARLSVKEEKKNRKSVERLHKSLRDCANSVPRENAEVLSKVLELLQTVANNAGQTKMSSYALAVCFAPVFFLRAIPEHEIPIKVKTAIYVTETIINSASDLFPKDGGAWRSPLDSLQEAPEDSPRNSYISRKSSRFMSFKRFSRRKSLFASPNQSSASTKTRMSTVPEVPSTPSPEEPNSPARLPSGLSASLLRSLEPYQSEQCKALKERISMPGGSQRTRSIRKHK